MELSVAVNTALTIPRTMLYKIRFGSRYSAGLLESLGRGVTIDIQKQGMFQLGKHCVTRRHVTFRSYGRLLIGDKVFINENTVITCMQRIQIGSFTQIGNGVTMVDHDHDYKNGMEGFFTGDIEIGEYGWIGANAVILRGTKIGKHCVIGAGAVVKGEFPDNCVIAGNPAKIVKQF